MKPIWFFVGLILQVMGFIIFINGLFLLFFPPQIKTVLFDIHPNIWWGLLMILFGLIMYLKTKNTTV